MNGKIRATSDVQSDIRLSAQNDSRCHGRQSEYLSDDVRLPNTDKVNLFIFRIEIALRKIGFFFLIFLSLY